jgi:hypothetical protein
VFSHFKWVKQFCYIEFTGKLTYFNLEFLEAPTTTKEPRGWAGLKPAPTGLPPLQMLFFDKVRIGSCLVGLPA